LPPETAFSLGQSRAEQKATEEKQVKANGYRTIQRLGRLKQLACRPPFCKFCD
jgi:hypothetical protein